MGGKSCVPFSAKSSTNPLTTDFCSAQDQPIRQKAIALSCVNANQQPHGSRDAADPRKVFVKLLTGNA
jgi:hypothetical protein